MKSSAVLLAVLAVAGVSTVAQAQIHRFPRSQSTAGLQRKHRQPHNARRDLRAPKRRDKD